jgi:hypothetical protein
LLDLLHALESRDLLGGEFQVAHDGVHEHLGESALVCLVPDGVQVAGHNPAGVAPPHDVLEVRARRVCGHVGVTLDRPECLVAVILGSRVVGTVLGRVHVAFHAVLSASSDGG